MKNLFLIIGPALAALIGTPALAADMEAPSYKAPPPPALSWTGCYVGGNGGAAWLNDNVTFDGGGTPLNMPLSAAAGNSAAYGGQFGCDYQANSNWVVGLRGMWDGTTANGTASGQGVEFGLPFLTTVNAETTSFATAVVRVGYSLTPALMVYGVGGVAFAENKYLQSLTFTGTAAQLAGSDAPTGWAAGVGMSWMLGPNWDIFVEYNYLGLEQRTVATTVNTAAASGALTNTVNQDVQTILVGLDFRFTNWAAGQFGLK